MPLEVVHASTLCFLMSGVLLLKVANCGPAASSYATEKPENHVRYEEYIVEHEISSLQARNAALAIDPESIQPPPGCQLCTNAELRYCIGRDLINDHCCCDRRFHEVLPFIPHTCYFGARICKPIVPNCAEYERLRRCCCDKFVSERWKMKSNAMPTICCRHTPSLYTFSITLAELFVIVLYNIL